MIPTSKVLWGEGLFLRPQHFQRQDAYHEWRLAETARAMHPYAWGVRRARVDIDALASGVLRFTELQLIFPDGEHYSAPQEDPLPPPVALGSIATGTSVVEFHVSVASMRPTGSNYAAAEQSAEAERRFVQESLPAPDWFTSAADAEVAVLRHRVRILPDGEPRDHLVSMPLCRLRRSATGPFELDPSFIAPSMSLSASASLQTMLRRLLDVLQAKVDALYGSHREPSKHVIEFRSGDVASFWLLHTASSAFASLSHLHHHPSFHPERLYERMLELAGALLTFSKSHALSDLPPYSHLHPTAGFERLDKIVRDLLETVISTRYFAIALQEVKPSFHHGRLDSGKINQATSFYLGVQAALAPAEMVEVVPLRFKVGAPDDVDKLVLSAMSGVKLAHVPQLPSAIPVRPGNYYFSFDTKGPLYERMLQSQTVTVYVPSGISDLRLELFALNE